MKYRIRKSNQFVRDVRRIEKRGYNTEKMFDVIRKLADGETLDAKYCNNPLKGDYSGFMECHIQPDWLLIYRYHEDELILFLSRAGTHSDLFP